MVYYKQMPSPVGLLKLVASDKGLVAVLWEDDDPKRIPVGDCTEQNNMPILLEAERQLTEYFARQRTEFTIALDLHGTDFQKQVWAALLTIPFGETRTYGQIAKQINNPLSVRAVGGAANKNPVSIMVPCHRVIGAAGKLTGFAGGLANKACLLAIEAKKELTLW